MWAVCIRLFSAPTWLLRLAIASITLVALTCWVAVSALHVTVFVATCAVNSIALFTNFRIGLVGRFSIQLNRSDANSESLSTKNSVATFAALRADPWLAPSARLALLPFESSLVTAVLLTGWHPFLILLIVCLAMKVFGIFGRRLSVAELIGAQRRRDAAATKILPAVRHGSTVANPYYIYLRPFVVTGQIHAENPAQFEMALDGKHVIEGASDNQGYRSVELPVFNWHFGIGVDRSAIELNPEFEAILEKGVRQFGQLVALGRVGESVGAARIATAEEEWKRTLSQMGKRASGYLVIPSTNSGTFWELGWLKTLNFRTCFFLIPTPQNVDDWDRWQEMKSRLQSTITLPNSLGLPCLFAIDGKGRPHISALSDASLVQGKSIRAFISASAVGEALRTLMSIANHNSEDEIGPWIEFSGAFLESIWDGNDCVVDSQVLNQAFRDSVLDSNDELLLRFRRSKSHQRLVGLEEVHHKRHAAQYVKMVRHEVLTATEHFIVYITLDVTQEPFRLLGFALSLKQLDLGVRREAARAVGSG